MLIMVVIMVLILSWMLNIYKNIVKLSDLIIFFSMLFKGSSCLRRFVVVMGVFGVLFSFGGLSINIMNGVVRSDMSVGMFVVMN